MKPLLARILASRPVRAWQRVGKARGTVLAGGIAYAAFFSLFPALAAGFSVFGLVVRGNTDLQQRVVKAVNDAFGTPIVKFSSGDQGVISLSQLTSGRTIGITGLISIVLLIFSGLGWLDALREGIRAMFGQPVASGNVIITKARDLVVTAVMALLVLISAVGGVAVTGGAGTVLGWLGLGGSRLGQALTSVLGILVLLAIDFVIMLVMFRLLSGLPLQRADLVDGALVGAVGLGLIKIFSGVLLDRLTGNALLAVFALAVGILVWLNLISRIILIAASWAAVTILDRGHSGALPIPASGSAAPASRSVPAQPVGPGSSPQPVISTRAGDRVSVAAGAVLGAAAMAATHSLAGAARTLSRAVRGGDR